MTYDCIPLGEVASLQAGYGFPVELQGRTNGDYPFAKVGDISRCGRSSSSILASADHFVDERDLVALRAKLIPEGSVLFAKIGEAIRQNHRVVAGRDMLIDNNAMAAVPGKRIDSRFLYHYLKTVDFYRLAPATTVPALRKSDLEKLSVPFPPLPEQRHIAAILDKADALRAKRRETLAQLDSLAQSIFLEMFGDPVVNSKRWPRREFGELLSSIDSGWSPVCLQRPVATSEWGVLKLGAVTGCVFNHRANKALPPEVEPDASIEVKPGDLLFSRKNTYELVAACAYVDSTPPHLMMSDLIFRLQVRDELELNKRYLHALLTNNRKRAEVQKLAGGSAGSMPNISKSKLLGLKIEVPPIFEQLTFASRVQAVERAKSIQITALNEAELLFASLQHSAFRGEL